MTEPNLSLSRKTMQARLLPWLRHTFIIPTDALPLRMFEVLFTMAFLLRMGRNFTAWREWLTDEGFRLTPAEYQVLNYPTPFPALEAWMVPLLALVLFGSGLAVIMAWQRRIALWLLLGCAVYVQGVDFLGSFAYNKIFIGGYALLATGPGPFQDTAGRWVVSAAMPRMIQATLVVLYFAAGIAKAFQGDWLKYNDVLWTKVQGLHRNELAALLLRTLPKGAWMVMQHAALIFELGAPMLFLIPRLRWLAIAWGLSFHFMIAALMAGLVYFTVQMWSFYAVWITANEWRSIGEWVDLQWKRLRGR